MKFSTLTAYYHSCRFSDEETGLAVADGLTSQFQAPLLSSPLASPGKHVSEGEEEIHALIPTLWQWSETQAGPVHLRLPVHTGFVGSMVHSRLTC